MMTEKDVGHFWCCWNKSATLLKPPSLWNEAYLGAQIRHTLITSCSAMAHRSLHFQFSDPLCEDAIGRSTTRYGQLKGGYYRLDEDESLLELLGVDEFWRRY